ncbi:hypothetical protein AZF37_08830 [endosymbiont 'TC1' of Trimyema compressum]|uniref:hypothetical protein n=1 Tax=endosymbiont 'TC1' of Trimyema compressum TaxID=243899 RepID=UPI0007F0B38B|nr:hypothetical protein [endosymbiont 'TC1' of Trimyema compressum]AMP21235.1 hypothetical protein AZF37_08830 [endosymbiont 'TC1' of Trimyema compressum]
MLLKLVVLAQFQTQNLEAKKAILNESAATGAIAEDQKNTAPQTIEERQVTCDGTGNQDGQRLGLGLGNGNSNGNGTGACDGSEQANGMGQGNNGQGQKAGNGSGQKGEGLRDGSCYQ